MNSDLPYHEMQLIKEQNINTTSSFIMTYDNNSTSSYCDLSIASSTNLESQSLTQTQDYNTKFQQALKIRMDHLPYFEAVFGIKSIYSDTKFNSVISKILDLFSPLTNEDILKKKALLHNHIGSHTDGSPWIDLEAALILITPYNGMNWKVEAPIISVTLPRLPANIATLMKNGQYVPLQHVLHALSLGLFKRHSLNDYPFPLNSVLPEEFIDKLSRADVIRGINVYSSYIGQKFPLIALTLSTMIDEIWQLMYVDEYSAIAGMEVFNKMFFDFSVNLGQCVFKPIEGVKKSILQSVKQKYSHNPDCLLIKCD